MNTPQAQRDTKEVAIRSEQNDRFCRGKRGIALILALLFLSFLTILGGALLTTAAIDIRISDNYKTGTQALYVAEAGIDHAREILRTADSPTHLLAIAAGADRALSVATDLTTLLATDDQPLIPSDPLLRATGEALTDSTGRIVGSYHVWLRNDIADGMAMPADTNEVLTLLSFGRIGDTQTVIEVIARKARFPKMPAALALDGPVAVFTASTSNVFEVEGHDAGSAGENENAIGVINNSDIDLIAAADLADDVANVDGELHPLLKTVSGLESLVAGIAAHATDVYNLAHGTPQLIGNYGDPSEYKVAVVNGDVNLGPGNGYGILVARGNVVVMGNFNWNGLILIIGQGVLHWNALGNGTVNGGIFIARTRATDGTLLASRGDITADFNAGGGNGVRYNTSAIAAANKAFPYKPMSVKER
ncbi:MAG TPA: PilX N-terminal domain-containing pilus assembly protein [Terriglobia bacterium]|nr:PilX N-terminal domain-containing pilus assembly protein [Terriglobia bacterium]